MSAPATGVQEWRDIPWPKVERDTHTLQKRIYQASLRGDENVIHRLQRLMISSWQAKCLAVRRVTQDNQGKNTAGVDGIKSLTPAERLHLVNSLSLDAQPSPTRRVWIPKPGTEEKRPLGIPTMPDRALQALVKLALEPEWEAKFEPNSYGFRPGRSCHDAIAAIFTNVSKLPKYVLDADISKCFDRINHEALLKKVNTFPRMERLLRVWLKAGVLDGDTLFPTEEGTPQGGIVSPLLANIALHGLETVVTQGFPLNRKLEGGHWERWKPVLIRYADDFVILHRDPDVIRQCREIVHEWLQGMGLELKPSKTRMAHTLEAFEGEPGFDFLGFHVRQYQAGKHQSKQGFKTIITPSQKKVKLHYERLAEIVEQHRMAKQIDLIFKLNPIIRGWCNYYRTVVSKATFRDMDDRMYHKLWSWAKRRHPKKTHGWIAGKYWRQGWKFMVPSGSPELLRHASVAIRRHVKVQGRKSPFDGDWVYWATRQGKQPGIPTRLTTPLRQQGGKCAHCGLFIQPGDLLEVHHKDGNHFNNQRENRQALHRHCHDQVHGASITSTALSIRDKEPGI
jgi:RNA-directed DNA polymerase